MKVFVSSDMEGTAGVVDWSQCLPGEREYEHYRSLLQAEVNAAITGAMDGGATEFLVNDSHSSMQNLRPAELAGEARYLSGRHKALYMMQARRLLRRRVLRLVPRVDVVGVAAVAHLQPECDRRGLPERDDRGGVRDQRAGGARPRGPRGARHRRRRDRRGGASGLPW